MKNVLDFSEKKVNPDERHYLTPGTRLQIIGSQNGGFPAFGHHVENEMGGIWMHPIKLLDGFWLEAKIGDSDPEWIKDATEFRNYPFYNEFDYHLEGLEITRMQISAENLPGCILRYTITNTLASKIDFTGRFVVRTDLRPVWYSETEGIISGDDVARLSNSNLIVKDSGHNWFTQVNVDVPSCETNFGHDIYGCDKTYGNGIGAEWLFSKSINPGESYVFHVRIAGSIVSEDETNEVMVLMEDVDKVFQNKEHRYQEVLDSASIEIPDVELMKQYAWVKFHMEWLTVDVPSVGRGLAAGIPEYSWWFGCDSAYALAGCVPSGFHSLAEDTIDVVSRASAKANGNGRIIHEMNSFGIVGNRGNTQETAHFIRSVYDTFLWTGNIQWLRKHYDDIKNGLRWLLNDMDADHDLFPEGYGIMEVLGLNGELIDTAVYTVVALKNAAEVARIFKEDILAKRYDEIAEALKEKINKEMWLEKEGLYADIRISGKELFTKLDDMIWQASKGNDKKSIKNYEQLKNEIVSSGQFESEKDAPWCFQNWVINTPIEMGLSSYEVALKSLQRLNSDEFNGEYGMYLSGLENPRMMTISTGVQINANLRYFQTNEALKHMKNVMKTFNMYLPGSISEMSPDYGCFVQAWTSYAYLSPLICGFIGVKPNAFLKTVEITPQLPDGWDFAKVNNLKMGTNEISVEVTKKNNDEYFVKVFSKENNWIFVGADEVVS